MPEINVHISISGPVTVEEFAKIMPLIGTYPVSNDTVQGASAATTVKTTKTKAEPAKETKVEPKEEPAAEPVEEQGDVPSADDVTDAAQAFIKANSREALIELLGTFDAKNISGLPEDKRAAFIAKCKA